MLILLAYNLTNRLRTLYFPEEQRTMQIDTIRTRIIKVASGGNVKNHPRQPSIMAAWGELSSPTLLHRNP
ncbi:hypothetical protein BKP37_08885 [Anaerobacillus alkalilacustris]|uniref:Transposase DDE domain-containing protein n=1 Tax=Anaerobacillus alkalilacustris TaxID=393763 RepID=A0A1S2LPZ7_9BACI|nr:hypothetical protein BKP37_08885 [Anaerobacillus alkalilacustris]